MAARTRRGTSHQGWDKAVRERISVSMLTNRLQKQALGEIQLNANELKAIEILLRKTLPDLSAVEHSGELQRTVVVRAPAVSQSSEDWSKQYAPVSRDVGTNGKPDVTH